MKATIITTATDYSVTLENGKTGLHPQPKSEISKEKYQRLLVKNYGYDFLLDKIDQALNVIEDDFDPNITDPITGEVTEPAVQQEYKQEPFINPLKQDTMETTKSAEQSAPKVKKPKQPAIEAEVIKEPKHSVLAKSRGISARLAESGIRGVGVAGCTLFYGISDAALLCGDLWAQGAAAAIKPLGNHPDATRAEIAETIKTTANKTLATVYTVPLVAYAAVTKPKAIVDKAVSNVEPKVSVA